MAAAKRGTGTTATARSPRREATRLRLLTAAEEVLAARGFHGASVEDVCERAGFTRGAFYSNFGSKEELVIELLDRHTRGVLERIAELAAAPELSLEELMEGVFRAVDDRPATQRRWRLLLAEFELHALRDPAAGRAWARQQRAVRSELVGLVERMADQRALRFTVPTGTFVAAATAIVAAGPAEALVQGRSRGEPLARTALPALVRGALSPVE